MFHSSDYLYQRIFPCPCSVQKKEPNGKCKVWLSKFHSGTGVLVRLDHRLSYGPKHLWQSLVQSSLCFFFFERTTPLLWKDNTPPFFWLAFLNSHRICTSEHISNSSSCLVPMFSSQGKYEYLQTVMLSSKCFLPFFPVSKLLFGLWYPLPEQSSLESSSPH